MARQYRDDNRNNDNRRSSSRDSNNSRGNKSRSKGGSRGNKFLMMQVGMAYLDNSGYDDVKVRYQFSSKNDEYSWCVREKIDRAMVTTHWFGVEKGRELLMRAIEEGKTLNCSAFFPQKDNSGMQGNARINIFNIATEEELEKAAQDADDEAWEDVEDDDEEEDERPARKSKSKSKGKTKSKSKEEPVYDSDDDDESDEETDDDEEIQY